MIEADGLTRRFGEFTAVSRVSLSVPDGTILALLGPNGAGKTTTVRMLAGLLAPTSGTAIVADHDVQVDPSAVRARVGLVTDVPGLHEQMTLPAYLDFFARIHGMERAYRGRRIDELLSFFDLDRHRAERMVGFSKGMKQKVALARALLHDPTALFLDEPTSGLDPLAARAVRELIVGLKQANRSIILCTHDLDEAERLADQVAIMRQGRIVARDAPAVLRARASPETTVRVALAALCPAALAAITDLEGVRAPISVPAETSPDMILVEYRTPNPNGVNPRVIARLVAVGAAVVSVTCATRTLEEVYADAMSTDTGEAELVPDAAPAAGTVGGRQ